MYVQTRELVIQTLHSSTKATRGSAASEILKRLKVKCTLSMKIVKGINLGNGQFYCYTR